MTIAAMAVLLPTSHSKAIASSAGLHLSAWTSARLDLAQLSQRARRLGVGIYPLDVYYAAGKGRPGLGFGFGSVTPALIIEGMQRLRQLVPKT